MRCEVIVAGHQGSLLDTDTPEPHPALPLTVVQPGPAQLVFTLAVLSQIIDHFSFTSPVSTDWILSFTKSANMVRHISSSLAFRPDSQFRV